MESTECDATALTEAPPQDAAEYAVMESPKPVCFSATRESSLTPETFSNSSRVCVSVYSDHKDNCAQVTNHQPQLPSDESSLVALDSSSSSVIGTSKESSLDLRLSDSPNESILARESRNSNPPLTLECAAESDVSFQFIHSTPTERQRNGNVDAVNIPVLSANKSSVSNCEGFSLNQEPELDAGALKDSCRRTLCDKNLFEQHTESTDNVITTPLAGNTHVSTNDILTNETCTVENMSPEICDGPEDSTAQKDEPRIKNQSVCSATTKVSQISDIDEGDCVSADFITNGHELAAQRKSGDLEDSSRLTSEHNLEQGDNKALVAEQPALKEHSSVKLTAASSNQMLSRNLSDSSEGVFYLNEAESSVTHEQLMGAPTLRNKHVVVDDKTTRSQSSNPTAPPVETHAPESQEGRIIPIDANCSVSVSTGGSLTLSRAVEAQSVLTTGLVDAKRDASTTLCDASFRVSKGQETSCDRVVRNAQVDNDVTARETPPKPVPPSAFNAVSLDAREHSLATEEINDEKFAEIESLVAAFDCSDCTGDTDRTRQPLKPGSEGLVDPAETSKSDKISHAQQRITSTKRDFKLLSEVSLGQKGHSKPRILQHAKSVHQKLPSGSEVKTSHSIHKKRGRKPKDDKDRPRSSLFYAAPHTGTPGLSVLAVRGKPEKNSGVNSREGATGITICNSTASTKHQSAATTIMPHQYKSKFYIDRLDLNESRGNVCSEAKVQKARRTGGPPTKKETFSSRIETALEGPATDVGADVSTVSTHEVPSLVGNGKLRVHGYDRINLETGLPDLVTVNRECLERIISEQDFQLSRLRAKLRDMYKVCDDLRKVVLTKGLQEAVLTPEEAAIPVDVSIRMSKLPSKGEKLAAVTVSSAGRTAFEHRGAALLAGQQTSASESASKQHFGKSGRPVTAKATGSVAADNDSGDKILKKLSSCSSAIAALVPVTASVSPAAAVATGTFSATSSRAIATTLTSASASRTIFSDMSNSGGQTLSAEPFGATGTAVSVEGGAAHAPTPASSTPSSAAADSNGKAASSKPTNCEKQSCNAPLVGLLAEDSFDADSLIEQARDCVDALPKDIVRALTNGDVLTAQQRQRFIDKITLDIVKAKKGSVPDPKQIQEIALQVANMYPRSLVILPEGKRRSNLRRKRPFDNETSAATTASNNCASALSIDVTQSISSTYNIAKRPRLAMDGDVRPRSPSLSVDKEREHHEVCKRVEDNLTSRGAASKQRRRSMKAGNSQGLTAKRKQLSATLASTASRGALGACATTSTPGSVKGGQAQRGTVATNPVQLPRKRGRPRKDAGCIAAKAQEEELLMSFEDQREWLREDLLRPKEFQNLPKQHRLLHNCYELLYREMSRKNYDVASVTLEWPILRQPQHILSIFRRLKHVDDQFQARMRQDAPKLVTFLHEKVTSEEGAEWSLAISQAKTSQPPRFILPEEIGVVPLLALGFDEDFGSLFKLVPDLPSFVACLKDFGPEPVIAGVGDSVFSCDYNVIVERQQLFTSTTFLDALELLFAAYFVFNLAYPRKLINTLEYIQRYYVGFNPPIKATTLANTRPRITAFLRKMKEFERFDWNANKIQVRSRHCTA